MTIPLIPYLARIRFGAGARTVIGEEAGLAGLRRALVVTDGGIARSGVLDRVLGAMPAGLAAARYEGVPPNPSLSSVEAALALYHDAGCDGVIAVGGGSVLDAAKAVALLATHPGPLSRYATDAPDPAPITAAIAPVITVPTTAGTGSEIGRGMGIVLDDTGTKGVFISRHLIPVAAVCDPDLTETLPAHLAAATGMDALSHGLEAFLSPAVNPPADAVALDGVARLAAHLPRAVAGDAEARWNAMMGSVEGGMAMWKGLGPAHAAGLPLDALGLHHGTLVAILLPHAVRFVAPAVPPDRLARLAAALGCDAGGIPDRLAALNAEIGIPPGLRALCVPDDVLPGAAREAAASFFDRSSPRHGTEADYLDLLRAAMG